MSGFYQQQMIGEVNPIKDWLFFPHILLQLNPNNSQGEPREDKQGSNRPFLPRSMVFFIPTIKD